MNRHQHRPALPVLVALVPALFAIGCGTLVINQPRGPDIDYMGRAEFRDYSEQVFRHGNRVQTEFMLRLPDLELEQPRAFRRLSRAEAAMQRACEPLNAAVAAHLDGSEFGFFRRLKLPLDVTDCERKTLRAEALLDALAPDPAMP